MKTDTELKALYRLGGTMLLPQQPPPTAAPRARSHRGLLKQAAPVTKACDDPELLRKWILGASDPDCGPLGRLMKSI